MNQKQLQDVVQYAQEAFWARVRESYPTVKAGDLDPVIQARLDVAMRDAVQLWVQTNGTGKEVPALPVTAVSPAPSNQEAAIEAVYAAREAGGLEALQELHQAWVSQAQAARSSFPELAAYASAPYLDVSNMSEQELADQMIGFVQNGSEELARLVVDVCEAANVVADHEPLQGRGR